MASNSQTATDYPLKKLVVLIKFHQTTGFYHDFTMVLLWFYHVTMVLPWFHYGFYHGFTMVLPWFHYAFSQPKPQATLAKSP